MANGNAMRTQGNGGYHPDSDLLPTKAVEREVGAVREVLETRLDGVDDLITMLQESDEHRQGAIKAEVTHLQQLHEEKFGSIISTFTEKFSSIATQFEERDKRAEQNSLAAKEAVSTAFLAAKEAVAAALQAAKEAVAEQNRASASAIAKSEAATTKQIDSLGSQMGTIAQNLSDKIEDLKGRLNTIDGRTEGINSTTAGAKTDRRDDKGTIALIISGLVALMGIGSMLYSSTHTTNPVIAPVTSAIQAPQPVYVYPAPVAPVTKPQ
jgi:hypothetical protein